MDNTWRFYVTGGEGVLAVVDPDGLRRMNLLGNGLFGRIKSVESAIAVTNTRRYYLKDHLGSTRVVTDEAGSVLETYDYYPFGLLMPGRSTVSGTGTEERFTGHAWDEAAGSYYMVARRYDPALGRFLGVDPLGADYPGWSPYNYVLNNPVRLVDPTGMAPDTLIFGADGSIIKELRGGPDYVAVQSTFLGGQREIRLPDAILSIGQRRDPTPLSPVLLPTRYTSFGPGVLSDLTVLAQDMNLNPFAAPLGLLGLDVKNPASSIGEIPATGLVPSGLQGTAAEIDIRGRAVAPNASSAALSSWVPNFGALGQTLPSSWAITRNAGGTLDINVKGAGAWGMYSAQQLDRSYLNEPNNTAVRAIMGTLWTIPR
jgi:RHS repeat-associated protein